MSRPEDSEAKENVSIAIPRSLAERIGKRLGKSGFKTVDEYLTFVMQQVISELELSDGRGSQSDLSDSETASMEKKLKDLGYA